MLHHHSALLNHALLLHHLREIALFAPCLAFSYYLVAAACAVLFSHRNGALRPAYRACVTTAAVAAASGRRSLISKSRRPEAAAPTQKPQLSHRAL